MMKFLRVLTIPFITLHHKNDEYIIIKFIGTKIYPLGVKAQILINIWNTSSTLVIVLQDRLHVLHLLVRNLTN